jgi:hypothetical protein
MAHYRADLQHLHQLLGSPQDFPFSLVALPLRPTEAFRTIESLRKRGPDTDRSIRDAIRSTRGRCRRRRLGRSRLAVAYR